MNTKAYSILFCALLASTFFHELRAKSVVPVGRLSSNNHELQSLEALEKAAAPFEALEKAPAPFETLEKAAEFNTTNVTTVGLSLFANVELNVIGVVNVTAKVAILIDVELQIVVLLNGNTGAGVIIDLQAQVGVFVTAGLWVAAQVDIVAYVRGLASGGLVALLKLEAAVKFTLKAVTKEALAIVNSIVIFLIIDINLKIGDDITVGLTVVLNISIKLIALLKGSLAGLLGLIGAVLIVIVGDLVWLVNVLVGVSTVIVAVAGSLVKVIEAKIVIKIALLLSLGNGLEVLIYLLQVLLVGTVFTVTDALAIILNDLELLFVLIAQLGGNCLIGISGLFRVLATLVLYLKGKVKLFVLIQILIAFVTANVGVIVIILLDTLFALITILIEILISIDKCNKLGPCILYLRAIISKSLIYLQVNISLIIEKLLVGIVVLAGNLLVIVINILVILIVVVQLVVSIPTLIYVLIANTNTRCGRVILIKLGIQITGILKGLISVLIGIALLLVGDVYGFLKGLPIIGLIIIAVEKALVAAGVTVTLKSLLISGSVVVKLILGLIVFLTGLPIPGILAADVTAAANFFSVINISFFISIEIVISVGLGVVIG